MLGIGNILVMFTYFDRHPTTSTRGLDFMN